MLFIREKQGEGLDSRLQNVHGNGVTVEETLIRRRANILLSRIEFKRD